MANRISILQWRQHGDDEDSLEVRVFGADDTSTALGRVKQDHDIGLVDSEGKPLPEDYDAESAEDWDNLIYINADIDIYDGEEIRSHDGRRFRVNITELAGDSTS